MTLQTVVEADERRPRRSVRGSEVLDRLDAQAADRGDAFRRILGEHAIAQTFPADRHRFEVLAIRVAVAEEDVHHPQREGRVRSRSNGHVLVARVRRSRPQGIDADRARAVLLRLPNERPKVRIRRQRIRSPKQDQLRVPDSLRIRSDALAVWQRISGAAGGGADRPGEL
jgi:hypothetical protein